MLLDCFGHGESSVGIRLSRVEEFPPRQLSEALVEFGPAVDRTRHRNGVDSRERHAGGPVAGQKFRREPARRGSGCVQASELSGLGFPIEHEQIAANPVHHGFDHAQHGIGGDGRIHRRTAARQDLRAGLGCKRLTGRHDSLLRDYQRPAVVPAKDLFRSSVSDRHPSPE